LTDRRARKRRQKLPEDCETMAEEVERLLLTPFREILEKASIALENAQDADEHVAATMLRAAQSLAREGERAVKRIEPLCKQNFDEYGSAFVDKIKEDGESGAAALTNTTTQY
jgi:CRISPR/Cas system CSM-associated protein Csm2 small subunit